MMSRVGLVIYCLKDYGLVLYTVASYIRMNRVQCTVICAIIFFFYLEIIINRKSEAVTHALHFILFCVFT